MIRYYKEKDGDYLLVNFGSKWKSEGRMFFDARASAIPNDPSSVCTCSVDIDYLKECKKVLKRDVPKEWISQF